MGWGLWGWGGGVVVEFCIVLYVISIVLYVISIVLYAISIVLYVISIVLHVRVLLYVSSI